jgi:TonB family protein
MRKLLAALCLVAGPALADDAPILLKKPLPDGLTPPKPIAARQAIFAPRPPQRVMNGHSSVVVCFLLDVDTRGHTTHVAILKHSDDEEFDDNMAKAMRALRWKAAELDGKPVTVRMIFPSVFQGRSLQGADKPAPEPCSWDLYKPEADGAAKP